MKVLAHLSAFRSAFDCFQLVVLALEKLFDFFFSWYFLIYNMWFYTLLEDDGNTIENDKAVKLLQVAANYVAMVPSGQIFDR